MKDLLFSFHICQGKNISFAYAMVFENLKKVSFNIASEASYVYILSGQKFIKNVIKGQFWRFFENETFLVLFKQCAMHEMCIIYACFMGNNSLIFEH